MAGVKGRSGGARPNSGGARPNSGGRREGAGRKPAGSTPPPVHPVQDMLTFLQNVALGNLQATSLQVRAAIAAVQYTHAKQAAGGKKDLAKDGAAKVSGGRFGSAKPPANVVPIK